MRECAKSWWIRWRKRILESGGQVHLLIKQEIQSKYIFFSVLELKVTQVCSPMQLRYSKRNCIYSVRNASPTSQWRRRKRRKRPLGRLLGRWGWWWCWGGSWRLRDPCFHTAKHDQPQESTLQILWKYLQINACLKTLWKYLPKNLKIFTDACPKTWTSLGTGCYLFILGLTLRYQIKEKKKNQKNAILFGDLFYIYFYMRNHFPSNMCNWS